MESADWPRLIGLMAVVTLLSFVADSATLVPLFRRFVAPVDFREIVAIKGVSYFLNALNYSLAAGGMAWLVHRKHKISFMRAFSALMLFFFIDIIALAILLSIGWLFGQDLLDHGGAKFVASVPIVIIVVWSIVLGSWIYWNRKFDFFFFGFFRKLKIFQCFAEARSQRAAGTASSRRPSGASRRSRPTSSACGRCSSRVLPTASRASPTRRHQAFSAGSSASADRVDCRRVDLSVEGLQPVSYTHLRAH